MVVKTWQTYMPSSQILHVPMLYPKYPCVCVYTQMLQVFLFMNIYTEVCFNYKGSRNNSL